MARRYWLTTQWPPEEGKDNPPGYIWMQLGRSPSPGLGDLAFVYETRRGPRREREAGSRERAVERQKGRGGVVAILRVGTEQRGRSRRPTYYDGRPHYFCRRWTCEPLRNSRDVVPWSTVRRVLGWRKEARARGLGMRELDEGQGRALAKAMGLRLPP